MIKLFCSKCQEFIKDIDPGEANHLHGKETCRECEERARQAITKIEQAHTKILNKINALHNKAILEMEEQVRTAYDG